MVEVMEIRRLCPLSRAPVPALGDVEPSVGRWRVLCAPAKEYVGDSIVVGTGSIKMAVSAFNFQDSYGGERNSVELGCICIIYIRACIRPPFSINPRDT